MTRRALCIHGHFYQPSREDPLTGRIPKEIGADPYSNWNERINANCYFPNAQSGNFEKISFNLGPTLTRWMESNAPGTLERIAAAEEKNYSRWGEGNAMAQPYHHTILPLATRRDKVTQVRWGIADYQHTFGHRPEGMWLPETAVDMETLQVLAENGIRFTILAPSQAEQAVDVTRPYRVELAGGESISVFFYHSGLSTSLSFDANATINADYFIQNRLMQVFSQSQEDQIILLASDGELYGHHQPFRDKFLSYMLNGALHQAEVEYTSPGRWLKEHPAVQTVRIRERTSWSCEHGILRWSAECGCTPHSEWKRPLRAFMDAAAEVVDEAYLARTRDWLADPWQARDTYIRVVLGEESFESWQQGQTIRALQADESSQLQRLMKAQWERQRMYTSCGWFFEDFDRIEPRNNVQYAAHALALTESVCSGDCISRVAALLAPVRSASTAVNAAEIFNQAIRRFEEHA